MSGQSYAAGLHWTALREAAYRGGTDPFGVPHSSSPWALCRGGVVSDIEVDPSRRAVDRLTLFSDAVVAIAITLLAIDLPVPTRATVSQFWSSVRHNGGHYAAFAISFVAIAAAWDHHHDIFRYVQRMDSRMRTLNMAWLLTIVINPFATRLLTSQGHESLGVHALRFGFCSQALCAGAFLAVLHHLVARKQAPNIPASVVTSTTGQSVGLLVGFGLSIPVFFATTYGWALWFAGPSVVQQVYRARDRASAKPAGA
jgi:uncharacterized membrane protein